MNDLSIGCYYVLSACICSKLKKKWQWNEKKRIYVKKRRLSSGNHASIDAFLGRNRIVFISFRKSIRNFIFIYAWKLEISLFNYSSILFFILFFLWQFFESFLRSFSHRSFALPVDDQFFCVRASAITTSHEQTLTPIRPKSSAEFTDASARHPNEWNF